MQQIGSLQQRHLPPLTQFSVIGALSPRELHFNFRDKGIF